MRLNILFILIALCTGLCLAPATANAVEDSERSILARMRERQPVVDDYKQEGLFGENNRGYLDARAPLDRKQKVILEAENGDRGSLYALIGQRTGASQSAVAVQRARQIAKRSASGIWLQNEKGEWYKKQ